MDASTRDLRAWGPFAIAAIALASLVAWAYPELTVRDDGAVATATTRTRARGALLTAGGLLVGLVLLAATRTRRSRKDDDRLDLLQRERRHLLRRLALVDAGSHGDPIEIVGRRVVAAIAEETGAPAALLHVAPVGEPLAPEVVAAVGVSSVGAGSPPAVREALVSGIGVSIANPGTVTVRTSLGTVTPKEIVLRPIRSEQRTVAVAEIAAVEPLDDEQLEALDALLVVAGQAIGHALATEYAHRLSSEVRAQAAAVGAVSSELDTVFEAVADGLAVTDDAGEIVRVNAAGRMILGVGSLDDPASRRSLTDTSNPLLQALKEGIRADGLEVALRTDDGARRIIQVKISPLSPSPGAREAVAVFRDVTRERQLERDLRSQSRALEEHVGELERKQQELERATRLKSEFLANMSHELRTPLNAVIGFAEVLLDGTYGALNPKQKDCTRDVLAGGRHLLGLINDVLDLSKIEAGKMELAREDHDLAEIVEQALVLVTPQAAMKRIAVDAAIAPQTFHVHADPDRLRQVILNLVSNAVKFTPDGGRVDLEARHEPDGSVRVAVRDTGIGIAKEHEARLFKEFSQVDGSHTRRFGGTGLGLAISKRLVEMHGGAIGFESAPGKGSTFFFTVPRATTVRRAFGAPETKPRSRPSSVSSGATTRRHVLVIEPDAAAGRLIEAALREVDLGATIVTTWAAAREAVRSAGFDAAVLDTSVLDVRPDEALRVLRQDLRLAVVVTSILSEDELPWARAAGVAFVAKPIDRAVLVEQVASAIAKKGAARRALVVDAIDGDAVSALLEREGFAVELATSAVAAFTAVEAARPDVVVIEIDGADGDELLSGLVARAVEPIVVLTGKELDEDAHAALARDAALVVVKGTLSRSAFAARIAEVLADVTPAPRKRVLAVDDNEQNLRLISAVLAPRGIDVLEARDATTAIDLARGARPDAILMDVMLPDVDGLMTTRTLKGDPRTQAIPVIAVTANAMPGDAEKARDAGCEGYVTKPIEASRLLRALEAVLPT